TYVLSEPLDKKDFVLSKRMDKSLQEYKSPHPPAHVEMAKILMKRGRVFRVGDKIDYIVIDGSDKLKAIPADDYDPAIPELCPDRFY
ncbi:DNA polymerase domain-containing protein, partial [Caballeronia sp. AAUFL_F1_KS47]|uniref:DNA polymerase domain-containing protein n=1 Tax=Caballeronia sp. AAUFL_F1_KS47 TaxID=2921771 RepID=UPI00202909AB